MFFLIMLPWSVFSRESVHRHFRGVLQARLEPYMTRQDGKGNQRKWDMNIYWHELDGWHGGNEFFFFFWEGYLGFSWVM